MNNIVKAARKGLSIAIVYAGGAMCVASEVVNIVGELMSLAGLYTMLAGGYAGGAGKETRCAVNDLVKQLNEGHHNIVDDIYSEI